MRFLLLLLKCLRNRLFHDCTIYSTKIQSKFFLATANRVTLKYWAVDPDCVLGQWKHFNGLLSTCDSPGFWDFWIHPGTGSRMTSATLTGIGAMSSLLHPSYPAEDPDSYSLSPGSPPTYCSLPPSGQIPIYAALQAANDRPPPAIYNAVPQMQYLSQSSMQEAVHNLHDCVTQPRSLRSHSLDSVKQERFERHPVSEQLASSSSTGSSDEKDPADVSYHENVSQWLNQQCGGMVKRKRKVSKTQRVAANQRERKRMGTFNQAFEKLRETIHCQMPTKQRRKMSRIQTLKSAIQYISDLTQILNDADGQSAGEHPDAQSERGKMQCWWTDRKSEHSFDCGIF